MARPRILPDADVLGTLRREGWTYDQIAERYGVSKSAVHVALTRSNLIETPRPRYEREIPWTVATEHSNMYEVSMLRLAARRDHGAKIRAEKARYLDNWIAQLQRHDAVVGYHPDRGFYYTKRRPGVDTGLIRKPNWLIEEEVNEGVLTERALLELSS